MQQIIGFIVRNGLRLLFLLLIGISLWLIVSHNSFHKSKFISSSNQVSGYLYSNTAAVGDYFSLREENEKLFQENLLLKELFFNSQEATDSSQLEFSKLTDPDVYVIGTKVIKNSYRKQKNFITLKGGFKQGVRRDMGVISDKGIVGIIEQTSDKYAVVLSLLNTDFQTIAKIKKNNHFGTLSWNGKTTGLVQLTDIPRIASVTKGDTVVTGFSSKAFPENIPVGIIDKVYLDTETNSFTLDVKLFSNMTTLNHVYVIGNRNNEEIEQLEKSVENNE